MDKNLECALYYESLGLSVIPVAQDKKPLIDWKKYQSERATKEQITKWFSDFPNANVGVVTGSISGIVVVDVEAGGKTENLPPSVISKTGGGGWHFFYKHPGINVKNSVRVCDKTDIRGDGGFVVMPPSIHKSGKRYEWAMPPDTADFTELPQWVLEKSKTDEGNQTDWKNLLGSKISEGARNATSTQLAGKLFYHLPPELWEITGWATLKEWNRINNSPPLGEGELRQVWESIKTREIEQRVRPKEDKEEVGREERLKPMALMDLMNKEFPVTEWLVERLIPSEAIVAISGAPAAFKTWLVLDLMLKVSKGDILFDKFVTNQTGVLLVDEENGLRLLQTRFKKLNKSPDLPIYLLSLGDFKLTKESVEKLVSFAKEKSIKLVVFDSLVRIHSTDENDASKMAGVFGILKKFSKEGIAVIFTHHNRKQGAFRSNPSQDMRGSSDILASVECHLAVERKPKEDYLTITQTKLRQGEEMKPFKLNIINDDNEMRFEYAGEVDEIQTKKADIKEAIREVLEQESRPLFGKELFECLKNAGIEGGYSTFKGAVKEMLDKEELFEKKGERNKTFFSLGRFDEVQEELVVG